MVIILILYRVFECRASRYYCVALLLKSAVYARKKNQLLSKDTVLFEILLRFNTEYMFIISAINISVLGDQNALTVPLPAIRSDK